MKIETNELTIDQLDCVIGAGTLHEVTRLEWLRHLLFPPKAPETTGGSGSSGGSGCPGQPTHH
jgi:hypothetical protein